jgi:hypothetical protein
LVADRVFTKFRILEISHILYVFFYFSYTIRKCRICTYVLAAICSGGWSETNFPHPDRNIPAVLPRVQGRNVPDYHPRIYAGLLIELGTTCLEMLGSHAVPEESVIITGFITYLMEVGGRDRVFVRSRDRVHPFLQMHSTTQSIWCRCIVCASQPRPPVEKN